MRFFTMLKFFQNAFINSLLMLISAGFVVYFGILKSPKNTSMFSSQDTGFPLTSALEPKKKFTQTHSILKNEIDTIEYDFVGTQ
ncbi:MAG: hypothetical protein B0W54_05095 [Cellvibrio sp. 79]|nr:MAG: hypothetical protein B0W54_05095 [Cellvibrio sp. 79]